MPMTQTSRGIFSERSGAGANGRATRPTAVPMVKVIADMRKGGTSPDASVKSASSDHMATAENPISVARAIGLSSPGGALGYVEIHVRTSRK